MNFISKLSPTYTPPAIAEKGNLPVLRDRILQFVFLLASIVGIFALTAVALSAYQGGRIELVCLYSLFYSLLLVLMVARDWPYTIRGHVAITMMYLFGLTEIFDSGQAAQLETKLLLFIILTSILFNYKNGIAAIVLSTLSVVATRMLMGIGEQQGITSQVLTSALTNTTTFLMLSTIAVLSITIVINGLEQNITKQAEMTQSLEYERNILEDRIQERTRSVARRITQLNTAAEITRSISILSEPDDMMRTAVETIREKFDLYYVGIFLLDTTHQSAILQVGTGDAGRKMLAESYRLTVAENSMIGWCILNRKARIALDVGTDAVRFSNPNLPLTRSELALPMISDNQVLGAITVQSPKPNAFDENDINLLKGIADSMAVALQNDRIYYETHQSLEEIRALNREYLQRAWAEAIESYGDLAYTFDNPSAVHNEDQDQANTLKIPLMLRNEVIGQLLIETDKEGLSTEEATFVDSITNQTAIALENARLLQETERRAIQEQKLNELTARFSRALSVDEILRAAAQELGQLPTVAEVAVRLTPADSSAAQGQEGFQDGIHKPIYGSGNGNGKEPTA